MVSARQKDVGSALLGRMQKSGRASTIEHTEAGPWFKTGFSSTEHTSTNATEVLASTARGSV